MSVVKVSPKEQQENLTQGRTFSHILPEEGNKTVICLACLHASTEPASKKLAGWRRKNKYTQLKSFMASIAKDILIFFFFNFYFEDEQAVVQKSE